MGKQPEISVLMSVYNETETDLKQAIESILEQSFEDFEFIIVLDNPSSDMLERIIRQYQKKDKRITFIKNNKNRGLAASLNRGLAVAKGRYIARMDADDIAVKERFEKQYAYMKSHPEIDFLFSWSHFSDESGKMLPERILPKDINTKGIFEKRNYFIHPTLMAKREVLTKERYDERFLRSQDFELWMRTLPKYRFWVMREKLLHHKIPNSADYKGRTRKMKIMTSWAMKGLNKNMRLYRTSLSYWGFYAKTLTLFVAVRLPASVLKIILLINRVDRKKA